MEKLIMLGTGNAGVVDLYNTCFALKHGQEYILVDAGGGNRILKQLQLKNISLTDIHYAIVTHAHTDHILGMIWIYRMIGSLMVSKKYQGDLTIYCHDEVKETLYMMIERMLPLKLQKLLNARIFIQEVKDHEVIDILGVETTFLDIASTKMKQFGFKIKLEKGNFVCLGDEPCAKHLEAEVKDAYFLLHEAFCLYGDREIYQPYEKHHSTVKEASELAQKQNVQNLVLYHTEEHLQEQRKACYLKEAKQYFLHNVYVPDDLDEIDL